jgi:DNA-binding MarR family transcriptional regulator
MSERLEDLAVSLFGELLTTDQLARNRISKALPKGMELSHFSVLNHLAGVQDERTPAQLAKAFHVTRGAMTNTLSKLEWAGHIHIRPDWDDARRKFVAISPSGRAAKHVVSYTQGGSQGSNPVFRFFSQIVLLLQFT